MQASRSDAEAVQQQEKEPSSLPWRLEAVEEAGARRTLLQQASQQREAAEEAEARRTLAQQTSQQSELQAAQRRILQLTQAAQTERENCTNELRAGRKEAGLAKRAQTRLAKRVKALEADLALSKEQQLHLDQRLQDASWLQQGEANEAAQPLRQSRGLVNVGGKPGEARPPARAFGRGVVGGAVPANGVQIRQAELERLATCVAPHFPVVEIKPG